MNSNLLKRYFENQCSPEERSEVTRWLSDEANKADAMRFMESMWNEHVAAEKKIKRLPATRRRIVRWSVAAVVATVILSVGISMLRNWGASGGDAPNLSVNRDAVTGEVVIPNTTVLSAPQTEEQSGTLAEHELESSARRSREMPKAAVTTAPQPRTVKASTMTKAQLVNEQKFLDLLASLDSTALTELFTYRHTHLSEIFKDIQKKYNLEIAVCDDSLNHMIVNKEFDAVNLRELLFQIRKEMHLTYAVEGNRILICFNREK